MAPSPSLGEVATAAAAAINLHVAEETLPRIVRILPAYRDGTQFRDGEV